MKNKDTINQTQLEIAQRISNAAKEEIGRAHV